MGGEKCTGKGEKGEAAGSPPRWRGKVRASRLAVGDGGITPAWAGKRPRPARPSCPTQDHPRTGGEKLCSSLMRALWSGSSPHGRGKGIVNGRAGLLVGITPALAGKSLCRKFGGTIF